MGISNSVKKKYKFSAHYLREMKKKYEQLVDLFNKTNKEFQQTKEELQQTKEELQIEEELKEEFKKARIQPPKGPKFYLTVAITSTASSNTSEK